MKKIIILLYLICVALGSYGQQDALYSQYLFNPLALNPAFAGSKGVLSAVLLHRSQWLGFDGAPTTQSFSIHSPLYVKGHSTLIHESTIKRGKSQFWKKIGLGLNIVNDKIGPNNNLGVFGSYAYRLSIGSGTLAMGLRAGLQRYRIDWDEIDYFNAEPDRNGTSRVFIPGFDFGLHYYTPEFFFGTAVTNLSKPKIAIDEAGNKIEAYLYRHLMVNSGFAMKINENIFFQPSFLLRYVKNSPLDFDINTNFLFYDKFWLGTGFRLGYGIVFLTQYYITDKFKVGYAYDTSFNKIRSVVVGSHEILIGYDFAKRTIAKASF